MTDDEAIALVWIGSDGRVVSLTSEASDADDGLWLVTDGARRRLTGDEAIALAVENRKPWEVPQVDVVAYERALFFGCWGGIGHYLRDPRGEMSFKPHPWSDGIDARLTPPLDKRHGADAMHHREGWTAWAMWDYSLDHRGGSNAVFLAPGTHGVTAMRMIAKRCFGSVLERIETYTDPPGRWYGYDYKGPTSPEVS